MGSSQLRILIYLLTTFIMNQEEEEHTKDLLGGS